MATTVVAGDFTMYSARAAIADGLSHIDKQVKSIEHAVVENPALAFDLAKTVVESVCKTILAERAIPFGAADDLPRLFRSVTANLPLLPVGASSETEVRRSLAQTLNGLQTTLQGVCELRNSCGFASHGTDTHRPVMESVQALLAAQAADAIVGFLHRIHRQERATLPSTRMEYEDNEAFNNYVDQTNEAVMIFDLNYRPSEVLFSTDRDAYRDALSGFERDEADMEQGAVEEAQGPTS